MEWQALETAEIRAVEIEINWLFSSYAWLLVTQVLKSHVTLNDQWPMAK